MAGYDFGIQIDAPPTAVFDYVADFLRHPEWSPDDMAIERLEPGATRVGSRYKAVGTLGGRRNQSEVEVTRLERPTTIAFVASDRSAPLTHTFTFTAKDGGTWVNRNIDGPRGSLVGRVMFAILVPIAIRPNFMKALAMLKRRVEAGAR